MAKRPTSKSNARVKAAPKAKSPPKGQAAPNRRGAPKGKALKTEALPSLRVEPEFRRELEAVLRPGETVSSFISQALRERVVERREQLEFIRMGLAAEAEAERDGSWVPFEEAHASMRALIARAKAKGSSRDDAA